jgi:hypothetical protein
LYPSCDWSLKFMRLSLGSQKGFSFLHTVKELIAALGPKDIIK